VAPRCPLWLTAFLLGCVLLGGCPEPLDDDVTAADDDGDDDTADPALWSHVAAGEYHTCGVRLDGTLA